MTQTIVLILYKVCVYSRVKTLNVMSMIFNYLTASQQFQYYSDTDDDWDHQLIMPRGGATAYGSSFVIPSVTSVLQCTLKGEH